MSSIKQQARRATRTVTAAAGHARSEYAEPAAERVPGSGGRVHRAAQVGTIVSVIVIAVVGLVGTLILANINSALPAVQNDQLNDSSTAILDGFAGAMQLLPVVLLVLVAALVIGVVQRIQR